MTPAWDPKQQETITLISFKKNSCVRPQTAGISLMVGQLHWLLALPLINCCYNCKLQTAEIKSHALVVRISLAMVVPGLPQAFPFAPPGWWGQQQQQQQHQQQGPCHIAPHMWGQWGPSQGPPPAPLAQNIQDNPNPIELVRARGPQHENVKFCLWTIYIYIYNHHYYCYL